MFVVFSAGSNSRHVLSPTARTKFISSFPVLTIKMSAGSMFHLVVNNF